MLINLTLIFLALSSVTHAIMPRTPFHFPIREFELGGGFSKFRSSRASIEKKFVLTYDDGPNKNTIKVLDILKEKNVKATFFVQGEKIRKGKKRNRDLIKRMFREGHLVASHDYSHGNNNRENEEDFIKGVKKTFELIAEIKNEFVEELIAEKNLDLAAKLHHENYQYFRFPYGGYGRGRGGYNHLNSLRSLSLKMFSENCINFVFWDIDTLDWHGGMKPQRVLQNIVSYAEGGKYYVYQKRTKEERKRILKEKNRILKKKNRILKEKNRLLKEVEQKNAEKEIKKIQKEIKKIEKEIKEIKKNRKVLKQKKRSRGFGGGIILMHDVKKHSPASTTLFLEWLDKNKAYQVVPLNELGVVGSKEGSTYEYSEHLHESCRVD